MRIGVYGSAGEDIEKKAKEKAMEIGRQIALRGHTLVTGACNGLPYLASVAAYEEGGECIGVSPAGDIDEHMDSYNMPVDGLTELILIGRILPLEDCEPVSLKVRNPYSVAICDAAIFLGGRIGTLNEITDAIDYGINCGILTGMKGTMELIPEILEKAKKETTSKIVHDSDPFSLVDRIIACSEERPQSRYVLKRLREVTNSRSYQE